MSSTRPIGVFDSGVGGLSVLRALHREMPHERFVYVADSGHAPYGERDDGFVLERSRKIADHLIARHAIKALVIACNTATAAAIHVLRSTYTELPIIGIEPALKPAAATSKTGMVGVMATRGTLGSEKFCNLLASLDGSARFVLQPCDGLADAIERADASRTLALCQLYTTAMGSFGFGPGAMDTLVLGCTHYPFASQVLQSVLHQPLALLEGGLPVARQTRRLLEQPAAICAASSPINTALSNPAQTRFYSTGEPSLLDAATQRWLQLRTQTAPLLV
ncbi:MAG: glutamate racemase [Rhodoferax sp.]|nr:glutamate racemase [Rhodoferax sp.]